MDMKDIFDPNTYTEEAMPLSTALCRALENFCNLDKSSNDVIECKNKHSNLNKRFWDSLDSTQKEMYNEFFWGDSEELRIETLEYFNRGFKIAMLLMKELLG